MSAPPPPVPVPDAAGWVLVAGVSASLHLAAASAMVLALAGQPQAPVSGTAGIVIRNLPPVTGTTAEPGRAQHTAVTDRLRPLDDPADHFVPHDHAGRPPSTFTREPMHVAPANADRFHFDHHLPGGRFGLWQILQGHGLSRGARVG